MIQKAYTVVLRAKDVLRFAFGFVIKCVDWLLLSLQQLIPPSIPSRPKATPPKIPSKKSKAYENYLLRSGEVQDKTKMSYYPAFILKGFFLGATADHRFVWKG